MTRRKLRLKLIENKKTRATTLEKRLQNLKKKAYEFTILCDVEACMIIFKPESENSPSNVEAWPSDNLRVESIINKYKHKVAVSRLQKKTFSIFDFFNMRQQKDRDKVAQISKANFEAKFPTWDDRIDKFSPEQIASCLTKLDLNIEVVKKKIMLMKEDDKHKLMQSESRNALVSFGARSSPSSSDNFIPVAALHPWNRNLSDTHIKAHSPLEIPNHFNHIQAFPQKNSRFEVIREQPPLPAKPIGLQLPSIPLSLDPMLRMSMMNDLNFGVQSGIASSSNTSIPNNVMYGPLPLFSVCHDPRFGMPNNGVMYLDPASVPLLPDPRSSGVQNNEMFKEPKSAFESCFYAPSMQAEVANTYNQQQLMMPHVLHQMHPYDFTDFYYDINEHETKNKKPRI